MNKDKPQTHRIIVYVDTATKKWLVAHKKSTEDEMGNSKSYSQIFKEALELYKKNNKPF